MGGMCEQVHSIGVEVTIYDSGLGVRLGFKVQGL